jgi:vanillate O-demethylase ferredoxin subunit
MALSEPDGFTVVLGRSGGEFFVPDEDTILNVLRNAGIDLQYSCEQGICGACEVNYLSGQPEHRDSVRLPEEHDAEKTILICCAGSQTPRLVLDL